MRKPLYILLFGVNLALAVYLFIQPAVESDFVVQPLALVGEKPLHLVGEQSLAVETAADVPLERLESTEAEFVDEVADEVAVQVVEEMQTRDRQLNVCRVWGPESSEQAFDDLKAQLVERDVRFDLITAEIEAPPRYLVVVEADSAATEISTQLQHAGIENYVIRRDLGTVLSTGVFSSLKRAEIQRDKVKKLNVKVAIEILQRYQQGYYLQAQVPTESPEYLASISGCATFAHAR